VEKTIDRPASASSFPVKPGQDVRLVIEVTQAASKTATPDTTTSWVIQSARASYSGAVTVHYVANALIVLPLTPFFETSLRASTELEFSVINPTKVLQHVTIGQGGDSAAALLFKIGSTKLNVAPGKTETAKVKVTSTGDTPGSTLNCALIFDVKTNDVTEKTLVVADVVGDISFYEAKNVSCGKITFDLEWTVKSDGLFHMGGSMHDSSVVLGDDYYFAAVFKQALPNGNHLGQSLKGSMGTNSTKHINITKKNAQLKRFYAQTVIGGCEVHATVNWGLQQILDWIKKNWKTIVEIAGAVASVAS
jgi:hypothetical protein